MSAASLLRFGPMLVGAVILWAGIIKAASPYAFTTHLHSLGWIPQKHISPAVTAIAALESGWGVALIVGLAPRVVLPFSALLLACLSAVSWWGVKSGKASDCGCYGGYIQPSIGQSIGINATLIVLLLAAWRLTPAISQQHPWQAVVSVVAAILFGGLAQLTQRHERQTGKPMFDTNPLKMGATWRHSWASGTTSAIDGEMLVAFLGPDCPFCKQWVRVGNAMTQSPDLPSVVGVVAATPDKVDSFIREHGIRFPVGVISESLMARLARAVPTTIHVVSGRIQNIWVGALPPEFVVRFTRAFFPNATMAVPDESHVEAASRVVT